MAEQSIGHMRSHGCTDLVIYCQAISCNHSIEMNADHLPDDLPIRSLALGWCALAAATVALTCGRIGGR
jgi:hypothetical protein